MARLSGGPILDDMSYSAGGSAHEGGAGHDRRFRCVGCGLKWFIPAGHARDDLTRCEACGAPLQHLEHADARPGDSPPGAA